MPHSLPTRRHRFGVDLNTYLHADSATLPLAVGQTAKLRTDDRSSIHLRLSSMFSSTGSVRGFLVRRGQDSRSVSPSMLEEALSSSRDREMSNYTTAPSSTFERNTTPVPTWPLPPLTNKIIQKAAPLTLHNIKEVRPSASKASLSGRDAQPRPPAMASSYEPSPDGRFPATPPFPPKWSVVHDRAICVLDACDYPLGETIKKMRSAFPELAGSVLTPVMIDKRLRTLDQNINVDFFRIGLEHLALTQDDKHKKTTLLKAESKKAGPSERRYTAPSTPSFSSISTSKHNSRLDLSEPSKENHFKMTPESDRSVSLPYASKIPKATAKTVVRSYPFDAGYMSYRTTADVDEGPVRTSGLTELVRSG